MANVAATITGAMIEPLIWRACCTFLAIKNDTFNTFMISAKNSIFALAACILFATSVFAQTVVAGADQYERYMPKLENKRVALVANQTSVVYNGGHLVDALLAKKVNLVKVFSPEHGFRGAVPDGETVNSATDKKTGLPILSLYGNTKKPSVEMMADIDVVVFDIQDVGTRFYTYISTMSLVMEACAEAKIPIIVLDRPNPNGHFVDGPVLEKGFESFVGMHPVPAVYGMTIGEYAQMVNGEKWLLGGVQCDLTVVALLNYNHSIVVDLPIAPSPNLPNAASVALYPSLCFFEGTGVSVGRGTDLPFQQFGAPWLGHVFSYNFTPQPNAGSSKPPLYNQKCYGVQLTNFAKDFIPEYRKIYLFWLLETYREAPEKEKEKFFNAYFDKLAGNATLKVQIKNGASEEEIRASWQPALMAFKQIRKKYLLYTDFE